MAVGDIQFGSYIFPKGFNLAVDEPEFEDDNVSVPMSIGSQSPPVKIKQRILTVTGALACGPLDSLGASMLSTSNVQSEVDRLLGEIADGTISSIFYNGVKPFIPTTWDRCYFVKPDKPRITMAEGSGFRYRDFAIPFIASDPRARLITPGNLIPDADIKLGTNVWGASAGISVLLGGGANSNNAFQYTGTGSASGFLAAQSQVIRVVPGQTYTLAANVNGSNITLGTAFIGIYDPYLLSSYKTVTQSAGTNSRISTSWTVPAGVYWVRVVVDTNNCTVANGQTLTFDSPKLEIGSSASAYSTDIYTPLHQLLTAVITDTASHAISPSNAGSYRSCPIIMLTAGAGATVGTNGMTITFSTPTGTVVITMPTSWTLLNGQQAFIVCDPLQPACIAAPAVLAPRSNIGGNAAPLASATFTNNAGNNEYLPYLDPGATSVSFQAGGAPAGGVKYQAAILWDDVLI